MGGTNSKEAFRTAILDLINNQQSVTTQDDTFWDRYWSDASLTTRDYFALVTPQDIKELREKASGNLTALCFKVVERINNATATACSGPNEHVIVLNCTRLLIRILPYLFEAPDWRLLFWSPANFAETQDGEQPQALAQVLLNSLADLLFCPDFTVIPNSKQGPENPDDLSSLDSCEYIWEAGIGCTVSPGTTKAIDSNRTEILKLLMTCFSEPLYLTPEELSSHSNRWLAHFCSPENRHVLPLLTSLINVVCSYDPVGYGVPYYYTLVRDPRGELVESSSQLLCLLFDYTLPAAHAHGGPPTHVMGRGQQTLGIQEPGMGNLFCSFVSRLHQNGDLEFIAKGLTTLLCNPLRQTYLPQSIQKIYFSQELYILFWKLFEMNKKFLMHMLRSPALFDLLVPLLYQLLETRTNPALVGMLHVGVFILLLLSGERNFGVRLNKPFTQRLYLPDIPKFTGTHADLLFLVFHKIITSGLPRLQPLYDCLLTVLVNVSPYLKSLSMVACARLMHLMESFATPWFLYAKSTNHYLVFYLLEIFNNVIQYQFDGNTNLIYSLIRSKAVFYQLANLPEDSCQTVQKRGRTAVPLPPEEHPAQEQPPGTQPPSQEPTAQTSGETEIPSQQEQPVPGEAEGEGVPSTGPEAHPVPDIDPPKRIKTIEVRVDVEEDSQPSTPVTPAEGAGRVSPTPQQVPPASAEGNTPPKEPTPPPSQPSPTPTAQDQLGQQAPPPEPPKAEDSPPRTQPHPQAQPPPSSSTAFVSGLPPHMANLENAPPLTFESSYDGPKPTKKGRPKGLSVNDLLPLHRDVGTSTKQLVEPATPDFKPTPEWVRSWKQKLPLNTILRVLQVLVPQVEKLCTDSNVKTEHEVLEYLKNGTLVGLLPVPHPILIRKYQTSESTEIWFHTYIWGVVYVRNFDPPIWYDSTIRLFTVNKQY